jgi:hypothetical protein
MIPCKPGEKGPELDTGGKSLDEVSFADAFIEIKSRNMEFVTRNARLNSRLSMTAQFYAASKGGKSKDVYGIAI